jgi:hypothetical protein
MAQTYKLTGFEKGDFQDNHGNYWCTAVLQGIGEPVKIVVKDPTKYHEGMELYGNVEEKTSKAGKPYLRFYREQHPDQQTGGSHSGGKKSGGYDSDGQKQGMAIKAASDYVTKWADKKLSPNEFGTAVKSYAVVLYEMQLKTEAVEVQEQPQSGYETAKAQADKLRSDEPYEPTPEELEAVDKAFLESIPF